MKRGRLNFASFLFFLASLSGGPAISSLAVEIFDSLPLSSTENVENSESELGKSGRVSRSCFRRWLRARATPSLAFFALRTSKPMALGREPSAPLSKASRLPISMGTMPLIV